MARTVWCATLLPTVKCCTMPWAMLLQRFCCTRIGFQPGKGPEGNIEYLMFVQKSGEPTVLDDSVAEQVVAASHSTLDR